MWVLIQGLPGSSKTKTGLAGREWWSDEATLLAHIGNQVAISNWMFMQSHSKDTLPKPDLIRLPGDTTEPEKPISPSRRRYLERLRAANTQDGDT